MIKFLSNLRLRFLLLVVLAVLPAVGLLFITVAAQRDQAVATAREDASRLVSLAAADQGRLIESTRQLLTVLARFPEIQAGGDVCDALTAELLTQFPRYINIGVINLEGMLTCSGVNAQEPVFLGDGAYFQRAIELKSFVVGEYQIGGVTTEPALNCGYPILDAAGTAIGVVYAAIDLDSLIQFAAQANLPEGSILTVLDRSGRVLARDPPAAELVGASLVGTPVVDTILGEGTGVTEERDAGETYVIAFESLQSDEQGNAFVSIAFPKSEVVAAAEKQFGDNLTRLGLAVMVILIAAWVGTDLIVRQNSDANKVLVSRLYDAFSTGGLDLLDEVVAVDFEDHDPMPGQPPGLMGLKQAVGSFRKAFPDGELVIEDVVAEGDRVVARVAMQGTHRGEYAGLPGTGQMIRSEGVEIFRVHRGKIVEGWSRFVLPLELIESQMNGPAFSGGIRSQDSETAQRDGQSKERGLVRSLIGGLGRLAGRSRS